MHVETYQRFISNMAVKLGCIIFSPEYRLAPEHPFPEVSIVKVQNLDI